jgi:hypothetical protein
MLKELAKLFREQGTATLSDYGLPEPQGEDTDLEIVRLTYIPVAQAVYAEELLRINPLTFEMIELFKVIKEALLDNRELKIILQGRAGSGKTTFNKYVMAYCRSLGKIALGCASTGLAASNYDDFDTAHSLFGIPVIEDAEMFDQEEDLQCQLHMPKYKQKLELISNAQLIVFEEISSQHKNDFNSVYVHQAINKFHGKVLILVGDSLQIPPVVKYGTKSQVCQASIYLSDIMDDFQKFEFTTNLRLQASTDQSQIRYDSMLQQISMNKFDSENKETSPYIKEISDEGDGSKTIQIYSTNFYSDEKAAIDFLHPNGFDTSQMYNSCVLAGTGLKLTELFMLFESHIYNSD